MLHLMCIEGANNLCSVHVPSTATHRECLWAINFITHCEGTVAKLHQAFQAMGCPNALKVVDCCLEEQHSSVQTLNVAGGRPVPRPRVRTAPGKDSVQWSCVPHTSCVSPSLSVWRYCSASWPAGLWSGVRTVWMVCGNDSMNKE